MIGQYLPNKTKVVLFIVLKFFHNLNVALLKVMFIYPQKVPSATHGVVYLVYYFIVCTKMKFIVSAFSFKLLALFCVLLHSVVML
jgi:hypothetical protein